MQHFVRTLAAALAVKPETIQDGVVLVLEAVHNVAVRDEWEQLTGAVPEIEMLVHPAHRSRNAGAISGPPPQDPDGFQEAVRELGMGAYRARLLIQFTARFLESEVGPIWWEAITLRCPAIAFPTAKMDAELPMSEAVDDDERPPLIVPSAWERGELPAWLRARPT